MTIDYDRVGSPSVQIPILAISKPNILLTDSNNSFYR